MDPFLHAFNEMLTTTYRSICKVEELMLRKLSSGELSLHEMHMLESIGKHKGEDVTITDLAQDLDITPPSVTAMVKRLEHKGFITKSRSGVDAQDVGCVVCATSSGTYAMPSMACQVHHALGLAQNIPVMDVGAACAGFLYAVETARCLMLGGAGRYALVVGSEQMSRVLDMTDRATCVLFGDGAGAALFALDEAAEYASVFGTTGDMAIRCGGVSRTHMTMDGQAVFRFAVATIPRCVNGLLEKTGLTMEQLDWVVCHQANERILDASARRLGCGPEKLFKNLDRYANTSAASIPIALDEMREQGLLPAGRRMALVGFGGGLTWAGLLMRS